VPLGTTPFAPCLGRRADSEVAARLSTLGSAGAAELLMGHGRLLGRPCRSFRRTFRKKQMLHGARSWNAARLALDEYVQRDDKRHHSEEHQHSDQIVSGHTALARPHIMRCWKLRLRRKCLPCLFLATARKRVPPAAHWSRPRNTNAAPVPASAIGKMVKTPTPNTNAIAAAEAAIRPAEKMGCAPRVLRQPSRRSVRRCPPICIWRRSLPSRQRRQWPHRPMPPRNRRSQRRDPARLQ